MPDYKKKYFTTGEFASLCRTTKETLFHYDRIGILKPNHIGNNKYRYYSLEQFYDYDLINTLKAAGSSLSEIKTYLNNHNTNDFLNLLKENKKRLEKERKKIERMEYFLRNAILLTEKALSMPYHKPELVENEEEYFIATSLKKADSLSPQEEIEFFNDHFAYCERNQIYSEYPLGAIVSMDTLQEGKFYESYYCTKLEKPVKAERLYIKPKGTYLTMLHKGFYDTRKDAYQILFDYMKQHNLVFNGNSYEQELISYLAVNEVNNMVLQISIQIK